MLLRLFSLILVGAIAGCAHTTLPKSSPRAAPPLVSGPSAWVYEVDAALNGRELLVHATISPGSSPELTVAEGGEPFVRDVEIAEIAEGGAFRAVAGKEGSWHAPDCGARGCRLRYRYLLGEAADALGDVATARHHGEAIEAPPSTWLLRPLAPAAETALRFRVKVAAGDAFVSGVFPVADQPDTYEARATASFQLSYSAFGRLRTYDVPDVHVQIAMTPGTFDAGDAKIVEWVAASARAVARYYGHFPVPHLLVIVTPSARSGVGFGTTMGGGGASISIAVGRASAAAELRDDWVLVHEMVHTALPDVSGPQHWLEEGLATYVEPLVRARAGIVSSDELWGEWVRSMPNGLPRQGDRGLDNTRTWGRTYWGGALFCLVADVQIRERTHNTKSLDDALRGILRAGGNIATAWDISRITAEGDAAAGVPVLAELYAKMGSSPESVDLPALWKRLGISVVGRRTVFDDRADLAPLAEIRRSMSAP